MEKWEYKIITLPIDAGGIEVQINQEKADSFLNQLGGEGWELVTIISTTGLAGLGSETKRVYCIFKRKISENG